LFLILQGLFSELLTELETYDPFSVRFTQAICAFLLHITSYNSVESAIDKIRFIYVTEHLTESSIQARFIAYMDFFIAMVIELGCMVTITRQNTCEEVVMNYVALQCISEIKRVFYAINDTPLKKEFEK
jgi:hypothetical protein